LTRRRAVSTGGSPHERRAGRSGSDGQKVPSPGIARGVPQL
jgi:hypothetical protein